MQRVLTVKANYFAGKTGYSVHIVTQSAHTETPHFGLSPAVRIHSTGKDYKTDLHRLIAAIKPDIVISLYGRESRFLHRMKDGSKKILEFHFTRDHLVHLVRGLPRIRFRRLRLQYVRILQYLDERCAPHYDRLVLLTEADRALWKYPANAVVIPNPLSFTSPRQSDLKQTRIIAAGRLIATKGFDLLIDAFQSIASRYPDWTLTIYGEGQDHRYLLDKIREYQLQHQVTIRPPVPDLAYEILKSSIYAAPSRYEGFGLVITEAMECGVPTVAFNCPCGPREIITHEKDGLLIKAFDIPAYAEGLARLMDSHQLRQILGSNARTAASRFSEENIMSRWQTLFHSLIHQKPVDAR
jgi:glycosyltransferase involved in cell wall biosynthesis